MLAARPRARVVHVAVGASRPRGCYSGSMARTQKVSVALETEALAAAKKAATRVGLSLSGLLMQLLETHFEHEARLVAMDRVLEELAPHPKVTERQLQSIRDEMTAPLKPVRRGRKKTGWSSPSGGVEGPSCDAESSPHSTCDRSTPNSACLPVRRSPLRRGLWSSTRS